MRIFIFVLLLVLLPILAYGQVSVRTEQASNLYWNRSLATSGDTIFTKAAKASGSAILHESVTGYITGVLIGTPVASDSVFIKNGIDTVTHISLPATGLSPYYIPVGARLDTSLVVIIKKTSNVTVLYRTTPQ